ncbi:hypothetical protein Tco_1049654 [Tanacetum coccineum]
MAQESISQTKQQEKKVAGNATNKRKREGNHNGGSSQQNKEHKVLRAQTTKSSNNKVYVETLPEDEKSIKTLTTWKSISMRKDKIFSPCLVNFKLELS